MSGPMQGRAMPYPFGGLAERLAGFEPPQGPFDPRKPWRHAYDVVHLIPPETSIGRLTLECTPAESTVALRMTQVRQISGRETIAVESNMTLAADALATPRAWDLFSRLRRDNQPVPESRLKRKLALFDGRMTVETGATRRVRDVPGASALSWGLFVAAQRLPAKAAEALRFTLIVEFEEPKPGQELRYRGPLELPLPARPSPLKLEVFEHTGEGIVPHVYARDAGGRLLIVVAGLLGWVWIPPGPATPAGGAKS